MTTLTRIFFSERSPARPLVREMTPPLRAPPVAAPLPGLIPAVPEVRVNEPPGRMRSYFLAAVRCERDS